MIIEKTTLMALAQQVGICKGDPTTGRARADLRPVSEPVAIAWTATSRRALARIPEKVATAVAGSPP